MLPKNFIKATDLNIYFVDLSETNYSRKQLISNMKTFVDFMNRFNCSTDELCDILDMYGILDKNLFEYTTFKTPYFVCENALYVRKQIREGYNWNWKQIWYDLYITENSYVSLYLNIVAKHIVKERFPFLFEKPFTITKKRFTDEINKLPKTTNARIDDIIYSSLFENKLTIDDIIKLYTDDTYKDSLVEVPRLNIYSDNTTIYLSVDEEKCYSVSFTIENLLNKDWKSIEETNVFSILLYDDKGNRIPNKWFNGKQKDSPYFNDPIVKELKKYFE